MELNDLSYKVIGLAYKIHTELGPGLLENVYKECLFYELTNEKIIVEKEKQLPVIYKDVKLDCGYRLDILVDNRLVIEIKSVKELNDIHMAQTLTYLKLGNFQLGLLINFNVKNLQHGIKRIANNFKK